VGFLVEKVVLVQVLFEHSSFPMSFNKPILCIRIFLYHQPFIIPETKKSLNNTHSIIIITNQLYAGYLKLYTRNNVPRVYNVAAIVWLQFM
jgi:hypothetical protein